MSTEIGRAAEKFAGDWLQSQGFVILDRNWRNRWCELDIVASQHGVFHIVEVKYRRRSDFGTGFEYITPHKARRLERGAMMWLNATRHTEASFQIDVISISGLLEPKNLAYLPNAIEAT